MTDEPSSAPSLPSAPLADADARSYLQLWAESVAQVLGQIAGAAFAMESLPETPAETQPPREPPQENDLGMVVVAAGALRGEMSLRIPRASALGVAQLFLGEPQDAAAEFKPDYQEAIEELLRQVAGQAATALKPRWGEVQLRLESAVKPSWSPAASGWLASAAGAACRLEMQWQLSAALHAALAAASQAAQDEDKNNEKQKEKENEKPKSETGGEAGEGNLGLLMDVELVVSLRFGERTMLLRDILELGEGSVVELDRRVEEPVDLLLDGKMIARGEVVVVDGNYGLRVQKMLNPLASE
jgi:flagellar motor switch protein FliN/FliY